jgi:SAM-dependent methyltransferase
MTGYDGWLDKYFEGGASPSVIVELGCGTGDDSSFLVGAGASLICCDIDAGALRRVAEDYPSAVVKNFDLRDGIPLEDDVADVVVASLCLHFFDGPTLDGVLAEIRRILKKDGRLLCRVNSAKEYIEGRPDETELSPGAYMTPNGFKRFYDEAAVREAFRDWRVDYAEEKTTTKFSKAKSLWELALTPKPVDNGKVL